MLTDFSAVMSERTDKQLGQILTTERENYQPEAVNAAQIEFDKRKLNIIDFAKPQKQVEENTYNINVHETPTLNLEQRSGEMPAIDNEVYAHAKKEQANKDMMWGAVWCVGGLIGTFSNTGFIFWGAIVFGGIQFFRGLAHS